MAVIGLNSSSTQNPPVQSFSLNYTDILPHWHAWQDWIQSERHSQLDRWLKHPSRFPRNSHHAYRNNINNAMFDAVRYQQLADALELTMKDPDFDQWIKWDQQWQPRLSRLPAPQHFLYWIQLRTQSEWRTPNIAQQKSRREHWLNWKANISENEDPSSLFMLWHGLRPSWLRPLQKRATQSGWSDTQLLQWIRYQSERPPLWLRCASDDSLEALSHELSEEGIQTRIAEGRLCALGGRSLHQTQAYRDGKIEVQDIASQIISERLDVQPGMKVWDACAGAGGKTLALAGALAGKGAVVATDLHQFKLDELKRRAKRAGIANIRSFEWDGEAPLRLPAEIRKQQGFDRILVDAPCSSSGTWRRNPDARWRLEPQDTEELSQLQLKLLTHAAAALRQSGKLVYATCSWQIEENEQIIDAFLATHPDWHATEQSMLGAPELNSDTMFYAILAKT